ncbi:neither inactivation nor afterpotential protein C [Anthonomus grandis grandis]|uniref:neither inactivation nor afterpotential protein C n=1 Tax=Anthonomus grandis grandis TaxID=2921223 RepID=UPI002165E776|nr:neither inactivation nor afterpotential protein C [Anthonomus grandis grandis]XP_050306703.1 neither inactivation nor afterpotential protein C [Anthonomus grandis grandis]
MKSLSNIPEPGSRYTLGDLIAQGVFGKVFDATDTQASNKKVAIKIQKYDEDHKQFVEEEYQILKELSDCVYIVSFYGVFMKDSDVWFILENCEGNTALDLVTGLLLKNRRMSEEHIGYILKELVKAIVYLHEHNIIHRDIKASNVLLTKEGEVKLCDFNLSRKLKDKEERLWECVGSPCWMAPEVVSANPDDEEHGLYDNRVDVWALGITAIELAEGSAPFQNMHPSRALFQIVKNPPPRLEKVSMWTEEFHDFISECLVKYYEHRPYIMEVVDHPFLQEIPENNYHLTLEIKSLLENSGNKHLKRRPQETVVIDKKYLKTSSDDKIEKLVEEDLADLDNIDEKTVLKLLEERFKRKMFYTFIGDILLSINPNEKLDIYGKEYHQKYLQKLRSDNAPHIYAIADTAYQNALHHKAPQQIVFTGESASGKTSNYLHVIDHLFYIGEQHPVSIFRIKNGIKLIHALTHASTPTNNYSTRAVIKTELSFGQTGKLTAASFKALCLEKWSISAVDMNQCNFHMIYYIYDGLSHADAVKKYRLDKNRDYRYLRIPSDVEADQNKPRDNRQQNVIKYKKIFSYLEEFEFSEEQITTFFSIIAAILNLGEIRFKQNEDDGSAEIENKEFAENFAELMEIDSKKFIWALTNYCLVKKGNVIRKKNTCDESRDSRDVLANNLYCRFVDYVIGMINDKLEIGKAIFGNKYSIRLLDFYGFECFKQNHLPQFLVNCLNEQLQYHYLQRIFSWEIQDLKTEEIEFEPFSYFDNKSTLNQLLSKPEGLLCIIDDAAKRNLNGKYIMDNLENQESSRIMITNSMEFSVAHYTGLVPYSAKEMAFKNRDFLPPEIIETMRESENPIVRMLFVNKLDRTGGLIINFEKARRNRVGFNSKRVAGVNEFSQIKNMRTAGTVFRCLCLELLKELSVGGSSGGTHFVRCIRSDLKSRPGHFNAELVRHQIRALSLVETARVRQKGYPQRVTFSEFLRRYKFLAFDFDENVEITKENCRLLLIRLKMEGWAIGKSQVFLKYYNEEYLARLYDTQVRKIVKIQSILRGFLAKCKINKQIKAQEKACVQELKRKSIVMTQDEAAEIIQKAYRRNANKGKKENVFDPLGEKGKQFIMPFARKWKLHSVYHVLMQYRAAKLYDFFNLSQQVHFYNQTVFFQLQPIQHCVNLSGIDQKAQPTNWLGELKPVIQKVNFRLDEIPFYDTSALCDLLTNVGTGIGEECWDSPYQWRQIQSTVHKHEEKNDILSVPYNRDPEEPLASLPTSGSEEKLNKSQTNRNVQSNFSKIDRELQGEKSLGPKSHQEYNGKAFKQKQEMFTSIQLKRPENKFRYDQSESTYNSTPANKDFEFIKSTNMTSKPKNADPIAELRNIVQRRESGSEDDPPFNFQGMLRKTNFQRDSFKKVVPGGRRDSIKNALEAVRRFSLPKDNDNEDRDEVMILNTKPCHMELMPGVILEGIEVEL